MNNFKINKVDIKSYGVQCRCNSVIKDLSMLMLQRLGYNTSQAYSRLAVEKGLVSLYDKESLEIIQDLINLVARFSYRFPMDDKIADAMTKHRDQWLKILTDMADDIEEGSEPVYCQTLVQWNTEEYGDEDFLKRYIFCRVIDSCASLTEMQKRYATCGLSIADMENIKKEIKGADATAQKEYIKEHLELSRKQLEEILASLTEATIRSYTKEYEYQLRKIENEKDENIRDGKYKAFNNAYFLAYLGRWSFRASYTGKKSRSQFIRNKMEFIYDIPSKTNDALRSKLCNNKVILERFKAERNDLNEEAKKLWPTIRSSSTDAKRVSRIQQQAESLFNEVIEKLVW